MPASVKNLVLFKLGWVACVVGAAKGMPWLGAVAVAFIALDHLRCASDVRAELKILGAGALIGLTWDTGLVQFGVLDYGTGSPLAPYWIIALWVLFATTLNIGMRWLQSHWVVAALAGATGGPMSFFAGAGMGAVTLADTATSLIIIGAGWAVLLPLLVTFAKRSHTPATADATDAANEPNPEQLAHNPNS